MPETPPPSTPDNEPPESQPPPPPGPDPPPESDPDAGAIAEMESFLGTVAGGRNVTGWAGAPRTVKDFSTRTEPLAPPSHIASYEILGFLGRGGMGVVYKAMQPGLKRLVALKMILHADHAGSEQLARFRTEAEAVARLQHPNIVQVHEVGEHEGRPFLVMEYVDGYSLETTVGRRQLQPRRAAELIHVLALAMDYAHHRGVVHRDLTPSNILMQRKLEYQAPKLEPKKEDPPADFGLVTADFEPKITDFGLAKRIDLEEGLTRSSAILGTPGYMAPEQASGRSRSVGPPADVHALGAILYRLLTGLPPFQGDTPLDTVLQLRTQEPLPPSRLQPNLPRDLETVCLKCLEKDPTRRYQTARALADDLQAYLSGAPVSARPPRPIERLIRAVRQRPALTVVLGGGGLALLGLSIGLMWSSPLAVGAVAVLGLVAGGGVYHARLQAALRESSSRQRAAERSVERLHLVLDMTRRLVDTHDLDSLLRLLSECAVRLTGAETATVYLVDPARRELWSRILLDDRVDSIRLSLGVGIAGTVAVTGETINVPDAYADARFHSNIDQRSGFRTRSVLALPLNGRDGRIIGVFQLLNKRTGPFTAEDAEVITLVKESAAVAIENAQRAGPQG
jgi:serine/threonine-protein kinase